VSRYLMNLDPNAVLVIGALLALALIGSVFCAARDRYRCWVCEMWDRTTRRRMPYASATCPRLCNGCEITRQAMIEIESENDYRANVREFLGGK
jgi:hypothetical protein